MDKINTRYERSFQAKANHYSPNKTTNNHIETSFNFRKNFSKFSIIDNKILPCENVLWDKKNLGGIPLDYDDENKIVYIDSSEAHTLLIGSTGSKKSRLVVMPLVRILTVAEESIIISDPKGEIYKRTAGFLEENNYDISVINFRDPQHSNGWNFLSIPYDLYINGNIDKACEMVNDVAINLMPLALKDPYWDSSARDVFVGLVLLLFRICQKYDFPKEAVNIQNFLVIRSEMFNSSFTDTIKQTFYWKEAEEDELIKNKLIGTVVCPERTLSCILSVFDQHVSCFSLNPCLTKMLSESSICLDSLGNRKNVIFIILPDEKTTFHKLANIFLKQSYEYLLTKAYNSQKDNRFPKRINYVLDEFSSLPYISDFPQMISASRSRNIRFHLVMQSKKQLMQRYDQETETIQSNCGNWLFLYTKEIELLKEISALAGTKDGVELIPLHRLQHLEKQKGECLVFSERQYPYFSNLADIDEYDKKETTEIPMPQLDIHKTSFSIVNKINEITCLKTEKDKE